MKNQTEINEWKTLKPFPEPTWELEGVECNGKIYLIGGITNGWAAKTGWTPNRFVYEYNPQNDEWTRKASIPLPLHHMAVTELNGLIYGFGGYRTPEQGPDDWQPVAHAWTYDPIADVWTELPSLPEARGASAASVLNGKIYIAGGSYACTRKGQSAKQLAPHTSSAKVFVFDPKSNSGVDDNANLIGGSHRIESYGTTDLEDIIKIASELFQDETKSNFQKFYLSLKDEQKKLREYFESLNSQIKAYDEIEDSKSYYRNKFDDWQEISNDEGELTEKVIKNAFLHMSGFYNGPLHNPDGIKMRDEMLKNGWKYLSPNIRNLDDIKRVVDVWYERI
jgi:hypothetical protein